MEEKGDRYSSSNHPQCRQILSIEHGVQAAQGLARAIQTDLAKEPMA